MPQWLRTHLARRRHVIADLNELMALEDGVARPEIVLILQRHVEVLFVWSSSFTLAGVEQLKDSWNFFGIGTNDIALCNRSHVKHFAVMTEVLELGKHLSGNKLTLSPKSDSSRGSAYPARSCRR